MNHLFRGSNLGNSLAWQLSKSREQLLGCKKKSLLEYSRKLQNKPDKDIYDDFAAMFYGLGGTMGVVPSALLMV